MGRLVDPRPRRTMVTMIAIVTFLLLLWCVSLGGCTAVR